MCLGNPDQIFGHQRVFLKTIYNLIQHSCRKVHDTDARDTSNKLYHNAGNRPHNFARCSDIAWLCDTGLNSIKLSCQCKNLVFRLSLYSSNQL